MKPKLKTYVRLNSELIKMKESYLIVIWTIFLWNKLFLKQLFYDIYIVQENKSMHDKIKLSTQL